MKIARFQVGGETLYGAIEDDHVAELTGSPFDYVREMPVRYPLSQVRLLAPCLPSKVVGIGFNYRSAYKGRESEKPPVPYIFTKPAAAVIGPGEDIVFPGIVQRALFEVELGVVIGRQARNVSAKEALRYVLGYTCANDVNGLDLPAVPYPSFTLMKGCDTFCPLGPWIVTDLEPSKVQLRSYLNGEKKQDWSTSDLLFDVPTVLSFVSGVMTLLPGDVIVMGTPPGCGPMEPGDVIEVEIEGIGRLRNQVRASGQ